MKKKFLSIFLLTALIAISAVGSFFAVAYNSALLAEKALLSSNGYDFGPGSSMVVYNPLELGTTTLFSGTEVTANGTVRDNNVSFKIYGNDNFPSDTSIIASRQEYYLTSNGNQWIDTKVVPNNDTELELFFMIPEGYNPPAASAHPDVAGCCAINNATGHFGGPLILRNNKIQFLYGDWPYNSERLEASFDWKINGEYHSTLTATKDGTGTAFITDGTNSYTGSFSQNISGFSFNNLLLFAQQNNGSVVNQNPIGIKEARISQNGTTIRHFVAVYEGSTEFSETPAPSNCMYDLITKEYFTNRGSGNFGIHNDTSKTKEIDLIDAIGSNGLNGIKINAADVASYDARYHYIDGKGQNWIAEYLEVDQKNNMVTIYKYVELDGDIISYLPPITLHNDADSVAEKLLGIRTTNTMTVLRNSSGAWMEGIIGPIVNYTIKRPDNASDGITVMPVNINILNLTTAITAITSTPNCTGAFWRATATPVSKDFYTSEASGNSATIYARNILFAPDKILQQYAKKDNVSGKYYLNIDIEFLTLAMTKLTIRTENENGIEIGGVRQSSVLVNGKQQSETFVVKNRSIRIEAVFNYVLYEVDNFIINGSTMEAGTGNYSYETTEESHIISFTPTSDSLTIEFTLKPKMYYVQILGKTTNDDDFLLEDQIKNGYTATISYKLAPQQDTILETDLHADSRYVIQSTSFSETCIYDLVGFKYNNGKSIDGILTISADVLEKNSLADGKFTIYAVYQKKYIINVEFEFGGNKEDLSKYELSSNSAKKITEADGLNTSGYIINEGETAVILLKPDKRYSVLPILGENSTLQISPVDLPELLVVDLNQSYNINVSLKNRIIKIDYELDIVDNISRTIFGVGDYISNGTASNFTQISAGAATQALAPNQEMLDKLNYRAIALKIYNVRENRYDLITDKFTDGKLDASNSAFFNYYVDEYGNSKICLFVIQQFFVDFSTPGFTQNDATFTNSDLGSYTVKFVGGEYTSLGDGKYMVDFGTKVELTKTVGTYGNFVHFTGLNDEENEAGLFIVSGDRYVGINFESTKLAAWVMPTIYGGSGVVIVLALAAVYLIIRSIKLKKQKLEREAEIRDMKRKFNISDEIQKLRDGEDVPQS